MKKKKISAKSLFESFDERLSYLVKNDEVRVNTQYNATFIILCIVAVFMTLLNILTHKGALTASTAIFAVLCGANIYMYNRKGKLRSVAEYAFMVEILVLFSFFLISGNPEGFSSIWITLLPPCALLLYQLKRGSLLSGLMWLILIFLLYTKTGNSFLQYDYTESFKMRFPILFIADFALAFFLELIRQKTFDNYNFLMAHDPLTGAFNRRGFFEYIYKKISESNCDKVSFIMMDLDHFKNVNDTYGHDAGDAVLKASVNKLEELIGLPICRWGGEEFAVFDFNGEFDAEKSEKLVKDFGELIVEYNEYKIPINISVGVYSTLLDHIPDIITTLSKSADECLYEAKTTGRNKAVVKIDA